ncbi:CRISPR-associated protein, partial [Desulfovibrio piger]|uniref:CRISPR-associated protein n=1 Tax=Desulfovibrio piger TaxID=901 RepID=UPI0026EB564A
MLFDKKVDFAVLVSVTNANPNGDPLNGNRPRTDYKGFGEMSDVCIKRKLRNRMQDMGHAVFVQSDDRADDGSISLKERAGALKKIKSQEEFARTACEKWLDVRSFGQVFAFKDFGCASVGVRGPVSIHQAVSIDPVDAYSM